MKITYDELLEDIQKATDDIKYALSESEREIAEMELMVLEDKLASTIEKGKE